MDVVNKIVTVKGTKYIYMLMIVVLFLFKPTFKSSLDTVSLTTYISIFFVATALHLLSQRDKNWFRLDVLFILGFGIVHFQWVIMITLSDITIDSLRYMRYVSEMYINYATWLSTVGIVSWFFGYTWIKTKLKTNREEYVFYYKRLILFSAILFVLFLMSAGNNFLSGGIYRGEGGSSAGEGVSAYLQLLFSISILVLTSIVILSNKDRHKGKVMQWFLKIDKKYLVLAGTYILLFMVIGDRGAGLQVVMTFLVLFGAFVRPISLKEFSLIIVFGAIIMTIVGLGRSTTSGENILVAGVNKVEFSSGYDITLTLANSARTLYSALENVPENHDYFFGKLWLGKLMSILPMSQGIYLTFSGDNPYEMSSSRYITYLRYGERPPSGEGTSLIADIYLNLGLAGVILFMFILGLFFKKLQNELNRQKSIYWIISAGIFASVAFYMGRGGLFEGYRPILWGLVLLVLLVKKKRVLL